MVSTQEEDKFKRIELFAKIERARHLIAQYDEHQAYYRDDIDDFRYKIGRLDERLGDVA